MTDDLLARLNAIDVAVLTEVVRQDQHSSSFTIADWSVRRLTDKGMMNPDGLWLFKGSGYDNERSQPWSVVLKILKRDQHEPSLSHMWHWKRELFLAKSGLLDRLPGPVKSARVYHSEETSEGAWLWMEYVENRRSSPWVTATYAFAAHQLGNWNGACITNGPLPAYPWLARQHYRDWWPETNPEKDFQFPLNQKYIQGDTRKRYERLWPEREKFYRILDTLPQTFSHFDSQRRNLFVRKSKDEQDELVLVDWAMCGLGPLGAELFSLIGMSAIMLECSPTEVPQMDVAIFGSYLKGLAESGWSGDADVVRLAYVTWIAVWLGIALPRALAFWCTPELRPRALQQFGFVDEELYLQWLPLLPYSLDCADEAHLLIKKMCL